MNKFTLDQKIPVVVKVATNTNAKVQRKSFSTVVKGTILERLVDFAFSIPDFRRTDKGNCRHKLGDVIMLMILARMSKCVGRADIIEFGKFNLKKFQSMGMLKHGIPLTSSMRTPKFV